MIKNNIKAVDDSGHDKNMKIKIEQLEKCDRAIGLLVENLSRESSDKK